MRRRKRRKLTKQDRLYRLYSKLQSTEYEAGPPHWLDIDPHLMDGPRPHPDAFAWSDTEFLVYRRRRAGGNTTIGHYSIHRILQPSPRSARRGIRNKGMPT